MRKLTRNEIARTAFKAHQERRKDVICPYCKNDNADVVINSVDIAPFKDFYEGKSNKFTVMDCRCCNAVWSFYDVKQKIIDNSVICYY